MLTTLLYRRQKEMLTFLLLSLFFLLASPLSVRPALAAPGSFTLSATAYCNTTPPTAPAVKLTWTTSSGATSYDVYRNGALYASGITGTSFDNNANVTAGQSYSYYVVAKNSTGTTQSNTVTVSVPTNICPLPAISGQVTSGGSGVAGVTMSFSGAALGSTITDSNGNYTFSGLSNGSYTITPSKVGCSSFNPSSRTVTISGSSVTGQNFTTTCEASSVPVVLVHGWGGDTTTFGRMKSLLEGEPYRFTVYVYDYKELTSCSPGPRIEQIAGKFWEWLGTNGLQGKQIDVVAHSMGGLVVRATWQGWVSKETRLLFLTERRSKGW